MGFFKLNFPSIVPVFFVGGAGGVIAFSFEKEVPSGDDNERRRGVGFNEFEEGEGELKWFFGEVGREVVELSEGLTTTRREFLQPS